MTGITTRRTVHLTTGLGATAAALAVLLSGCARTPVTPAAAANVPSPSYSHAAQVTSPSPSSPTTAATTAPATPAKPVDPFTQLSKKTQKEFKPCLGKRVGPGASGSCVRLLMKHLASEGFYPWGTPGVVNMAAANAILNYQRSRGLTADAIVARTTWVALATKAPSVPSTLPEKCYGKGVVLCVDQAHRKLSWLKNGKVVKTFAVRTGGWNYLKKKDQKQGKWRVYGTADGTYKVFDKQVDPYSENYGYGAMPYSTMFHPDMYVHYSPGFHAIGYRGASHGCVNIGKLSEAKWIFKNTPIGAKVYVFSTKVKSA